MKGGASLYYAEMLAEFDTDVNIQDHSGKTALHWACEGQHSDMVKLCLSVPDCVIGIKDNDGLTAFDISLRSGNESIADSFYTSIMEMEETFPQAALLRVLTVSSEPATGLPVFPGTAIFGPIQDNNKLLVQALVDRGVDLTARNHEGNTALHVAAAMVDNVEIVTILLEAGSDVHDIGKGGATALQIAARTADRKMVQALQDWEAKADVRDNLGRTALQLAEDNQKEVVGQLEQVKDVKPKSHPILEIQQDIQVLHQKPDTSCDGQEPLLPVEMVQRTSIKLKLRNEDEHTMLYQAVMNADLERVRTLLELGADTEIKFDNEWTVLHQATESGLTGIVKELLASGANIEAVNDRGRTPLGLAALKGNLEIVKILLAGGANVHATNYWEETALFDAVGQGHTATVKTLLDAGSNIEAVGQIGRTALIYAAGGGELDVVKTLLAEGARIEAVDKHGKTALVAAAYAGGLDRVQTLLARGAQIEAADKDGDTALLGAASYGFSHIVEALLAAGAQIEAANHKNQTALQMASKNKQKETVKILKAGGAETTVARARTAVLRGLGLKDPPT